MLYPSLKNKFAQTEARFLPASTELTKFYGLTAAEQAEHEAKLNEKRKVRLY